MDADAGVSTGPGPGSGPEGDAGQEYDAGPYLPGRGGLRNLKRAASGCRGCPLFRDATQTVFGSGPARARLMLVGEQPGDQEDLRGEPFVGPAGRLLRRALDEAGLGDEGAYLTNAVKHFKFTPAPRGKRRIHKAPSLREMTACRPWLLEELRLVAPDVLVLLGATAGRALLGSSFKVGESRGQLVTMPPPAGPGEGAAPGQLLATVHPSAVLRSRDREAAFAGLVADLSVAAAALGRPGPDGRAAEAG
ncbi:UdgX family uracil-DNA binding protein [Streptomyces katrae]|uniref:Type-4 uracil-DNA glycosylase n=1 Tax=Streptomyces katrae TaxID=68223 RepID=A0ABT7GPS5_9ACTN|nr:UdgX family uracil-DNA binding protein [Streptomyces katrae]MDK9495596.1 UdgX family uracil-DNA binding protein [Streptomyces katrae]